MLKNRRPTFFINSIIIWVLLQIPRLIAIPLILDILDGKDSPAWMYPAVLDIVVALPSPFLAYALWKKRGLAVWTITVVYLVISIIDHGDAVTAALLTGTPHIFSNMGSGIKAQVVPTLQAVLDAVFLLLMTTKKNRAHFFEMTENIVNLQSLR